MSLAVVWETLVFVSSVQEQVLYIWLDLVKISLFGLVVVGEYVVCKRKKE